MGTPVKKIAFYIGSLSKGGAERVIVNLAEYFYKTGYEVTVVTIFAAPDEYEISKGIRRVLSDLTKEEAVPAGACFCRARNFFARLKKLRGIWSMLSPDVVVSFIKKNNFMALLSAKPLHIPVAAAVRSDPKREYAGWLYAVLVRVLFAFADGVILQTAQAKEYFPRYIQKKAVILPNSLHPAFLKERYGGERRLEIVAVGRIDANKNQKLLAQAFLEIAGQYPAWRCILYGDGEGKAQIEALAAGHAFRERLVLAGRQDAIEEKIDKAAIFVLPSDCEGMPNALIEAMALGLAVISTDCPCGGPAELIKDGVNGILIPVGDKEALKRALRRLMDSKGLRERLGENAAGIQKRLHPDAVNAMWRGYIERIARKA